MGGVGQIDADQECLDSIWQWDPPGELGESGAWQVVKALASTLSKYAPPVSLRVQLACLLGCVVVCFKPHVLGSGLRNVAGLDRAGKGGGGVDRQAEREMGTIHECCWGRELSV